MKSMSTKLQGKHVRREWVNIKRYLPTVIWYYCPRLRYDLPATCFRLFLLLRRKRFLSTLLDPRLPYPDSYMLRLPFDLLLSPTQFSSLSAVRMLAYNLYQPFILEVVDCENVKAVVPLALVRCLASCASRFLVCGT